MSPFVNLAASMGMQLMNQKAQEKQAAQAQEWTQQNMDKAFRLSQEAQRNAPSNTVYGLKMAGLNPALAFNGNGGFQAAPSSAPASPVAHVDAVNLDLVNAANQTKLADAQANLFDAQAEEQNIINERLGNEDLTNDLNLSNWLRKQVDSQDVPEHEKEFYRSLLDTTRGFNAGNLKALQGYFELNNEQINMVDNRVEKEFNIRWNQAKINHEVPETLAKMPQREYEQLGAAIQQIYTNVLLLASDTALNSTRAAELESEISKNIAIANSVTHGDFAQLVKDGDSSSMFWSMAKDVLETALSFTAVGGVVKLAKGAKVLASGAKAVEAAKVAKTAKTVSKSVPHPNPNSDTFQNLTRWIGAKNAERLFQQFQKDPKATHGSFERWLHERKGKGVSIRKERSKSSHGFPKDDEPLPF